MNATKIDMLCTKLQSLIGSIIMLMYKVDEIIMKSTGIHVCKETDEV